ncbi:MAG: cysteine desulfurase family protein [Cyanobacteriota bacterium]
MSMPSLNLEQTLYLDASATTPPAESVLQAMAAARQKAWANPSSLHGFGLAAAESLERSRQSVAAVLGCRTDELIFCSGGTEAAHLAIVGLARSLPPGRFLVSSVEHPAVAAAAAELKALNWEVVTLPVNDVGRIRLEVLASLLAPPTRLVSVIWGQNEVGTMQPIDAIGQLCRQAGVYFHTDAVQAIGHTEARFSERPVDLLSCTAHKLQGPRGIGALVARSGVPLTPLLNGGGQEGGRRAGTESVALAAGFAAALELCQARLDAHGGSDPIAVWRDRLLVALLELPGVSHTGCLEHRLPHHISLVVRTPDGRPLSGRRLVAALWREGFAVSSGSACSSGKDRGSAVLKALGLSEEDASAGLRISLGPWLNEEQLAALPQQLPAALARAMVSIEL